MITVESYLTETVRIIMAMIYTSLMSKHVTLHGKKLIVKDFTLI